PCSWPSLAPEIATRNAHEGGGWGRATLASSHAPTGRIEGFRSLNLTARDRRDERAPSSAARRLTRASTSGKRSEPGRNSHRRAILCHCVNLARGTCRNGRERRRRRAPWSSAALSS